MSICTKVVEMLIQTMLRSQFQSFHRMAIKVIRNLLTILELYFHDFVDLFADLTELKTEPQCI